MYDASCSKAIGTDSSKLPASIAVWARLVQQLSLSPTLFQWFAVFSWQWWSKFEVAQVAVHVLKLFFRALFERGETLI